MYSMANRFLRLSTGLKIALYMQLSATQHRPGFTHITIVWITNLLMRRESSGLLVDILHVNDSIENPLLLCHVLGLNESSRSSDKNSLFICRNW